MKKLFILLLVTACASSQNEKLNQQSIEMHEAALAVGKQANEKISQLTSRVEALSDSILIDSVASLKQGYEDWKSSIVEVPGHEHDHHDHEGHDHHHDHDHSPSPDLTPEMVLEVQTELKVKAEELNERATKLIELIESAGNKPAEEAEGTSGND